MNLHSSLSYVQHTRDDLVAVAAQKASKDLSLAISGLTLPVRVDNWDAQQITFTVPFVGLDKATDGMWPTEWIPGLRIPPIARIAPG
jgi:hypothetical protein